MTNNKGIFPSKVRIERMWTSVCVLFSGAVVIHADDTKPIRIINTNFMRPNGKRMQNRPRRIELENYFQFKFVHLCSKGTSLSLRFS